MKTETFSTIGTVAITVVFILIATSFVKIYEETPPKPFGIEQMQMATSAREWVEGEVVEVEDIEGMSMKRVVIKRDGDNALFAGIYYPDGRGFDLKPRDRAKIMLVSNMQTPGNFKEIPIVVPK